MGALERHELQDFFVETTAGRDPERGLRHLLQMKLEDEPSGELKLLVYGHGGCGKSTELVKLTEEISDSFFCVPFSVQDEMNLIDIRAEDIVLIMMEQLVSCAEKGGLEVKEADLQPIYDFFVETTKTEVDGRESAIGATGNAGVGTGFLSSIVKLLVELKSEIKLSSNQSETRVEKVRKRPGELLAHARILVNSVTNALPEGQRLLMIVEDLDKLDIASARKVFIENASLLAEAPGNIIYTIPIFTFHSNDAGILRQKFSADIALPMIKPIGMDFQRAEGFEIIREILHRRVDPSAIEEDAVDLLIEKTGGVLQHAFEVLHTAASMNSATVPLKKEHIDFGLQRKRNEFWSEIALPRPAPEDVTEEDLYDRLVEYARKQLAGEKNQPVTNEINQILLRSCALVEYNTQRWLGVHPLVIDNLRELGRLS